MDNEPKLFERPLVQGAPNPSQPQQPPSSNFPPPVSPLPPVPPPQPPVPPPVQSPEPPSSDNVSFSRNGSLLKTAVKVLIGLGVLLAALLVVFFVVLPFFNKSNEQVNLTYWGLWEDSRIMQGVIDDFEKQNPNIKITYTKEDPKQYRERLTTRIQNGTGPDIFRFHNTWFPMLSGVLLPFSSDTISKEEFINSFYPVAQKDLIRNGAIYGVPLEIDTLSLFVNSEMLDSAGLSPPTTWNDFINHARAITVKDENGKIKTAGAAMGTYDNILHAPDIISLLFLQNGVDLNNLDTSEERITGALSFYTSFATDQDNVWDNTLDPSLLAFAKGNLGMFFGYSWDYFTIKAFNKDLKFQTVPVPQLPNQTVSLASYWVEGVSVKSKHQKEALLFMKYLARKDTEEKLFLSQSKTREFGEPYARVDLADTLRTNPHLYPFVQQAKDAKSSPFVDSTNDNGLNQQANTYLGNAVNAMLSGSSPETAFSTFSKGVLQVFQKYGQK
jgi:multiple sugar transport system substrate-binding protein